MKREKLSGSRLQQVRLAGSNVPAQAWMFRETRKALVETCKSNTATSSTRELTSNNNRDTSYNQGKRNIRKEVTGRKDHVTKRDGRAALHRYEEECVAAQTSVRPDIS